jgi:putative SOS response-associated peptidase YedK
VIDGKSVRNGEVDRSLTPPKTFNQIDSFTPMTRNQDAMRQRFRFRRDLAGNLPLTPAIFLDTMAPIVRLASDGERELSMMRWGFPPSPNLGKVPVTNVRNLASPYWRGWLKAEWRCLVPANPAWVIPEASKCYA